MLHAAIEIVQPGDVLVVGVTSESTDGMFGDLLAVSCRAHGVQGLVIDAGVRDSAEITAMTFPIWSKAISAQGTVKNTAGCVNVPIVCAGMFVYPGDVIVGDQDGVVVVPRSNARDVVRLSEERIAKEQETRERLKNGQPTWRNPTEKRGKLVWYSPSIGSEPLVAEVVLERVREAAQQG